jgi:hypothetical protein
MSLENRVEEKIAGQKDYKSIIEAAIARLAKDVGAVFEPLVIEALRAIRNTSPADHQRYRKRIKDAGAGVGELDRLVCANGVGESAEDAGQGGRFEFEPIEPWPEAVNGAELLDEIASTFKRFVVLPEHIDVALALWVIHTYAYDLRYCSPIQGITSPQKRCGKTTLISLNRQLTSRALAASNITASSLFRAVDKWHPTLLIDEADTFIRESEEMRGILNSGHTRDSAFVIRVVQVGDDYEPRRFSTWAPKAIALIGKLHPTLQDRSIEIPLKRRLPSEKMEKLKAFNGEEIRRKCLRWVRDHTEDIRRLEPEVPKGLNDRAADNWDPLLTIAEVVSGKWPQSARKTAIALSGEEGHEDDSYGVQLLGDIRQLFKEQNTDRLSSEEIVEALVRMEDRPWAEYRKGQPITKNGVARVLKPFGIKPKQLRFRDGRSGISGYELGWFHDSFSRYLGNQTSTSSTNQESCGFTDNSEPLQDHECRGSKNGGNRHQTTVVEDVEVEKGEGGEEGEGGEGEGHAPAYRRAGIWQYLFQTHSGTLSTALTYPTPNLEEAYVMAREETSKPILHKLSNLWSCQEVE